MLILAAVGTTGITGLMDNDLREQWQRRLQSMPNPSSEILAGRILQPSDIIEIVVIEGIKDGSKRLANIGEVLYPALSLRHRSGETDFDAKRVAVQTPAFVAFRDIGEAMRSFEGENLMDIHSYATVTRAGGSV